MLRRCYADVTLVCPALGGSPKTLAFLGALWDSHLKILPASPSVMRPPVVRRVSCASAICHAIAGGPAIFKGSAHSTPYTLHI